MAVIQEEILPKYASLARKIERDIRLNRLAAGHPIPSIRNLVAFNKVSRPTVEKGLELLAEQGLINHYPKRGYFVAKRESTHTSLGHIAFVTLTMKSDLNITVKAFNETMDHEQFVLSTFSAHADLQEYERMLERVGRQRPAGIILEGSEPLAMEIAASSSLLNSGIPTVIMGPPCEALTADTVQCAALDMGETIAGYLISRGYRDFAMIGVFSRDTKADYGEGKIVAIRRELEAHGMELPEERIFMLKAAHGYMNPPNPYIDTQQFMGQLIRRGLNFKTLICDHDYPAIGALQALLKAGINVPEEIKLASVGQAGVEGVAPMKLTTVDSRRDKIARKALELLVRRIEGYDGPPEVHYVAPELVIGETA